METDEGNNLSHPAYGLKLTAAGGGITSAIPPNIIYYSIGYKHTPSFQQMKNAAYCPLAPTGWLAPLGVPSLLFPAVSI